MFSTWRLRGLLGLVALVLLASSCAQDKVVVGSPRLDGADLRPLAGGVEDQVAEPQAATPDAPEDYGASEEPDPTVELPEGFSFDLAKGEDEDTTASSGVGAESPATGASLLLNAVDATEAAESYRFELMFAMEVTDPSTQLVIAPDTPLAVGSVAGADTWTLVDMGPLFRAILDGAEQSGETEAMASAIAGTDLTMEAITIGTSTMYLRAPLLDLLADFGGFPNSDEWVGVGDGWAIVDLSAMAGIEDFDAQDMAQLTGAGAGTSAEEMLELLGAASGVVVESEGPQIRGVDTTRYEANVNVLAMLESQGADSAGLIEFLGPEAADAELPFEVFVDSEGRVRRIGLSLDLSTVAQLVGETPPPGTDFSFSTTFDIFDYGATIEVLAPPPDEVFADWTDALLGLDRLAA